MKFAAALAVLTLGLTACTTLEQRVSGAAVGAGTGAVVAGPVGRWSVGPQARSALRAWSGPHGGPRARSKQAVAAG